MLRKSSGVRHDPLRSSGGLHEANRLQRGVAEFLRETSNQRCSRLFIGATAVPCVAPGLSHQQPAPLHGAGCWLCSALPAVIQQAEIPPLRDALAELRRVMHRHGHDTGRIALVMDLMSEATAQLVPKPSDEPEAAHPRR